MRRFTEKELETIRKKGDPDWRKAKAGARLILRARDGKISPWDRRLAQSLATDPGVENRLIDQAIANVAAKRRLRGKHVSAD